MPRKRKRTASALETVRLQQEIEKLLLLRMKRQKEQRLEKRRKRPDPFDRLSAALGEATASYPRAAHGD